MSVHSESTPHPRSRRRSDVAYKVDLRDVKFQLFEWLPTAKLLEAEKFADWDVENVGMVIEEALKIAQEQMAACNVDGDRVGAQWKDGVVTMPDSFKPVFDTIAEGGWIGLLASPEFGGMGLPVTVTTAVNDMMSGAALSLGLNPLLTQGQIEALEHHASDAIKEMYLPKLISGEWTGTMNLTEPQAGSDVGALITKAERNDDGSFAISGQKIYITWGDTDFAANVCHLVLARIPGASPGTKGISLFLVPKFIPDAQGNPGVANSLRVVSLEHKLGLHGSPTCVMQYDRATGWLVGEENDGMAAMFTMMNNARLGVGVQGVGIADGAFQNAFEYALNRKQGRSYHGYTIAAHADVRRMLTSMKADLFAARAIALSCAVAIDMTTATEDPEWAARAAFLTPIAKAFGTDIGNEVANTGIQVHGGMGFVEETGAAQFARDVRVTTIYEGTNGIQAMDLVARKMADGGEAAHRILDEIEARAEEARALGGEMAELAEGVWQATESLREATEWLVAQEDLTDRFAGAVPYLRAFARVLGGHFHLKAALADRDGPRLALARFYITRLLPEHEGLLVHAQRGSADLYALSLDDLAA
ncbi:MAG: acyl-CoA dehydrogenase [Rhodobacteraceae bacterium]|nr:MAG: acyl-CoA dehydrogenase [Paracoccaceae bacterium]